MTKKTKKTTKRTKTVKIDGVTVTTKTKRIRRVFDKKLLCFKKRKGKVWDTSITSSMIKEETPERDILFRTVKLVMKEETKTFADVIRFRVDWLVPDSKGNWGTEESIDQTLKVCKYNLELIDEELIELGFKKVGLVDILEEEDRRTKEDKTLSNKLASLGLELFDGEQLHLFSKEDSSDSE
jgi:hypothetical protein